MKKIVFTLIIALASSFAFTSCTEEEVTPAEAAPSNGGGAGFSGNL
jgi:hypothetical protein